MAGQDPVARLSALLVARAGGYLRSPVRDGTTCLVCAGPVAGFDRCYRCQAQRFHDGLADATGFVTYAVAGQQSGYVMRGYKAPVPLAEHRTVVTLLAVQGLLAHGRCPAALAGRPVTHWAAVPSLPARPGEHPLHKVVAKLAPGPEAGLVAAAEVTHPRGVRPEHFRADQALPPESHVLLLEDTWVGGGHAQSAVLALRRAGAARVSLLALARWLNKDYGATGAFLRELGRRDFDPAICPWTGSGCPDGGA